MRVALLFVFASYGYAASDYLGRLGYRFEQVELNQRYVAGGPGYRVSLSRNQVSLTLPSRQIHMTFEGASRGTTLSAEEVLPGRTNHLEGADPAAWRTDAPAYRTVRYRQIYAGIDLVFYGSGKTLEYDYVLRPGADPASIRMRISGASKVRIDEKGDLILGTGTEDVRWKRPVIYQAGDGPGPKRRRPVRARRARVGEISGRVLRPQPRTRDRPCAGLFDLSGRRRQ